MTRIRQISCTVLLLTNTGISDAALLQINGLDAQVEHWRGPAARAVVADALARPDAHPATRGSWRVVHRQEGPVSDVLQWKEGPDGLIALRSRLDLSRPPRRPAELPFATPSGCHGAMTVETGRGKGRASQWTVHCPERIEHVVRQMQDNARHAGWRVAPLPPTGFEATRGRQRVRVSASREVSSRITAVLVVAFPAEGGR